MKKNKISKNWLAKQKKDHFFKKSKIEGFRSRSAYKLIEMEKKFKFFKKNSNLLDLGSSPGGWSQVAAQKIADNMLTRLHWALKCGNEGGDLNDVLYTVKALGMVVSTDVDFDSGPAVMNGFSLRWQSIFGGLGEFFKNGKDDGGYSGIHARSAIGGFTGRFSIEPEIIVAIPPELSIAIIKNRGWLFPVDPRVQSQLKK